MHIYITYSGGKFKILLGTLPVVVSHEGTAFYFRGKVSKLTLLCGPKRLPAKQITDVRKLIKHVTSILCWEIGGCRIHRVFSYLFVDLYRSCFLASHHPGVQSVTTSTSSSPSFLYACCAYGGGKTMEEEQCQVLCSNNKPIWIDNTCFWCRVMFCTSNIRPTLLTLLFDWILRVDPTGLTHCG
jgi:hypothetical protein